MDPVSLSGVAATSSNTSVLQATSQSGTSGASTGTTSTSSSSSSGSVYYSSPIISFDAGTGDVVWKYRDTSTGEILYQSPSAAALQYERSQKLAETTSKSPGKETGGQNQSRVGQNVTLYG